MNELISVIIPVYNMEQYLRKCVDSVLSQTYKDLEIILVNYGSSDNSAEICEEYKDKDNRVKLIHKENEGVSEARNMGLEEATGNWISFIDSDDYMSENMLEILLSKAVETCSDMAVAGMAYVTEQGAAIREYTPNDQTLSGWDAITHNLKTGGGKEYMCNKLYRRHLFEHIRFPKGRIFEDSFVMYQLMAMCNKIVFIPRIGYYYTQRESSLSKGLDVTKQMDSLVAKVNKLHFLEANRPGLVAYSKQEIIQTCGWLLCNLLSARKKNKNKELYKAEYKQIMETFQEAKKGAAYPYFTNRLTVLLISISSRLYFEICSIIQKKGAANK